MNETSQDRLVALLDSHGGRLYAALTRLTWPHAVATDLFQELFLRLSRSPGFATASNPAAYGWRAAMNLATEWRRQQRVLRETDGPIEFDEPAERPDFAASGLSPLDRLIRDEQTGQILDALCDLTELARECFVRRWIELESYESIAAALGKTQQQIRGMCHAAMRQLRSKLAPEFGNPVQAKAAKANE